MGKVKYVTRSAAQRAWWDDLYHIDTRSSFVDRITVHEGPEGPQSTGLLDAQGNELFRLTEKHPIGFRVLKEC